MGVHPNEYGFSGATLPTEAEWEYAAKNGGTAPVNAYATGSTATPTCSTVNEWLSGGCVWQTSNVDSSSGLYDMAGNLFEWTCDWYSSSHYANFSGRLLRVSLRQ